MCLIHQREFFIVITLPRYLGILKLGAWDALLSTGDAARLCECSDVNVASFYELT